MREGGCGGEIRRCEYEINETDDGSKRAGMTRLEVESNVDVGEKEGEGERGEDVESIFQ